MNNQQANTLSIEWNLPSHKMKIKESEKINRYLDLGRKQKKQLDMKVMMTTNVFGAIGTVSKGLEKKLGVFVD